MPTQEWFVGPGEEDNEEFGDWLRECRHTAGLSRAEAANRLEFSSEYIRLIERGKRTPVSADMGRICAIYEIVNQKLGTNVWLIDGKTIVFTSRVLESRQLLKIANRLETLGWVVDHLTQADDLTLARVQKLLKKDL